MGTGKGKETEPPVILIITATIHWGCARHQETASLTLAYPGEKEVQLAPSYRKHLRFGEVKKKKTAPSDTENKRCIWASYLSL